MLINVLRNSMFRTPSMDFIAPPDTGETSEKGLDVASRPYVFKFDRNVLDMKVVLWTTPLSLYLSILQSSTPMVILFAICPRIVLISDQD